MKPLLYPWYASFIDGKMIRCIHKFRKINKKTFFLINRGKKILTGKIQENINNIRHDEHLKAFCTCSTLQEDIKTKINALSRSAQDNFKLQ